MEFISKNNRLFYGVIILVGSCLFVYVRYVVACDMNFLVLKSYFFGFFIIYVNYYFWVDIIIFFLIMDNSLCG